MDWHRIFSTALHSCCSRAKRLTDRDLMAAGAMLFFIIGSYVAFAPPYDFSAVTVRIESGTSLPSAAQELAAARVISHPLVLRVIMRLSGESHLLQAGAYRFDAPESVFTVANRLVRGEYGLPPIRMRFVEGFTIREAAEQLADAFPGMDTSAFIAATEGDEGFLFPDTYFFSPSSSAPSIAKAMRANFDAKIAPLEDTIRASGHSLSDIVTMASLVEKEARTTSDREMIAGILWNRIEKDMPLQVDAVFGYIFNRGTYSPSYADLKVDSPYNTYTHKGLPPGPIGNPSLDAITAVLHPATTTALYYLSDQNGDLHTAVTYAAHQANQRKYLR